MTDDRPPKPSSDSGQVLVEFALVLGLLLFILMGMFVVGYWMSAQQVTTLAARQGAREAALTLDNERVAAAVMESMHGFDPNGNKTQIDLDPSDSWDGRRNRGNFISVEVTYKMPFSFSFNAFGTVVAKASARIECSPKGGSLTCPPGQY